MLYFITTCYQSSINSANIHSTNNLLVKKKQTKKEPHHLHERSSGQCTLIIDCRSINDNRSVIKQSVKTKQTAISNRKEL